MGRGDPVHLGYGGPDGRQPLCGHRFANAHEAYGGTTIYWPGSCPACQDVVDAQRAAQGYPPRERQAGG